MDQNVETPLSLSMAPETQSPYAWLVFYLANLNIARAAMPNANIPHGVKTEHASTALANFMVSSPEVINSIGGLIMEFFANAKDPKSWQKEWTSGDHCAEFHKTFRCADVFGSGHLDNMMWNMLCFTPMLNIMESMLTTKKPFGEGF
jgi:hypothetical protein